MRARVFHNNQKTFKQKIIKTMRRIKYIRPLVA